MDLSLSRTEPQYLSVLHTVHAPRPKSGERPYRDVTPCHEAINAEGVAQLYFNHVFPRFGVPSKIITDRDPRFTSQFMRELCTQLRIEQNVSTAYHPRTDGQSERTNQWLEQYLRFWVNHHQDNWHQLLPMAEYAHNSWRNETTKTTPYQTLMGYNPTADWRPVNASVPAPIT